VDRATPLSGAGVENYAGVTSHGLSDVG